MHLLMHCLKACCWAQQEQSIYLSFSKEVFAKRIVYEVTLPQCLITYRTIKSYGESGGIAQQALNLSTKWK
jgi:hypothetical protein